MLFYVIVHLGNFSCWWYGGGGGIKKKSFSFLNFTCRQLSKYELTNEIKQWSTIPPISTGANNHLSSWLAEHKKDLDIWLEIQAWDRHKNVNGTDESVTVGSSIMRGLGRRNQLPCCLHVRAYHIPTCDLIGQFDQSECLCGVHM